MAPRAPLRRRASILRALNALLVGFQRTRRSCLMSRSDELYGTNLIAFYRFLLSVRSKMSPKKHGCFSLATGSGQPSDGIRRIMHRARFLNRAQTPSRRRSTTRRAATRRSARESARARARPWRPRRPARRCRTARHGGAATRCASNSTNLYRLCRCSHVSRLSLLGESYVQTGPHASAHTPPRNSRDSSPRTIHVTATVSLRLVSGEGGAYADRI